jgi:hypothetical protein
MLLKAFKLAIKKAKEGILKVTSYLVLSDLA